MAQQKHLVARPVPVAGADLDLGATDDPPIEPYVEEQLDSVNALHDSIVIHLEFSYVGYTGSVSFPTRRESAASGLCTGRPAPTDRPVRCCAISWDSPRRTR